MKTLKNVWRHSKFTAFMMVSTTLGWALMVSLMWWGLIFMGAALSWILVMVGITLLFLWVFWIIWAELGKVYG